MSSVVPQRLVPDFTDVVLESIGPGQKTRAPPDEATHLRGNHPNNQFAGILLRQQRMGELQHGPDLLAYPLDV